MTNPTNAAKAMDRDEAVRVLVAVADQLQRACGKFPEPHGIDLAEWSIDVRAAADALTSPPAVPDGFVVAPTNATDDMKKAARHYLNGQDYNVAGTIYRAMLAAAPPSEPPSGEPRGLLHPDGFNPILPSPAEQGAREDFERAMKANGWSDRTFRRSSQPGHADEYYEASTAGAWTAWRLARAPLAAGRVGVGEEMRARGLAAMMAFRKSGGDWTTKPTHAVDATLEAALAGPLVAGEVDAWEVATTGVSGKVYRNLQYDEPDPAGYNLHTVFRPLVYADTVKGNGNG